MEPARKYMAQHVDFNAWVHIFVGLGIAWLLSLIWQGCSVISLVLGIVFLVAGIVGHIYARIAGRKMEA